MIIFDSLDMFGWDYLITIPLSYLLSRIKPWILDGIFHAAFRHFSKRRTTAAASIGLPVPPSSWHLPTYPLSVAAPDQWWAFSTPQKRSDLNMFFFVAGVSWGDLIVASTTVPGWKSMLRMILKHPKTCKNIMTRQEERPLKRQQKPLGDRKIGRPDRLRAVPA